QLDDAEPGHHQRERGPVPGQERPLVGQGEPDVRLLDARFAGLALLVLVVAARGSSPTPPLAGAPMVTPGCGTGVAGYLLGWPLTLTSRPARTRRGAAGARRGPDRAARLARAGTGPGHARAAHADGRRRGWFWPVTAPCAACADRGQQRLPATASVPRLLPRRGRPACAA